MALKRYDAIIIGAGMSGMAAGIRLAMFGKKTLLLERHTIPGGLNSYYQRGKRSFDVGLHALTNFAKLGEKKRPLLKLLRRLKIPYEELQLGEQIYSQIRFPEISLNFTNNIEFLIQEIREYFPHQVDRFRRLVKCIQEFNATSAVNQKYISAKKMVAKFITDPLLLEMIFCPLLIYGSAWENDMDFPQFVIMFQSLFLEGFARPRGGIRSIIRILLKKLEKTGCEVRFKMGVKRILTKNQAVCGVLTDSGERFETDTILSSAGHPETLSLLELQDEKKRDSPRIGKLSFTEGVLCLKQRPQELDQNATIIFYNNASTYHYERPSSFFDQRSAVICFPNNFERDDYSEGLVRLTFMSNYNHWRVLREKSKKAYKQKKAEVLEVAISLVKTILPNWNEDLAFSDIFTPTTITKYTGHFKGTVYGSPDKIRDGRTSIKGLYLCGTDQGFLGIIGSLLSGVTMANLHGPMRGRSF